MVETATCGEGTFLLGHTCHSANSVDIASLSSGAEIVRRRLCPVSVCAHPRPPQRTMYPLCSANQAICVLVCAQSGSFSWHAGDISSADPVLPSS